MENTYTIDDVSICIHLQTFIHTNVNKENQSLLIIVCIYNIA